MQKVYVVVHTIAQAVLLIMSRRDPQSVHSTLSTVDRNMILQVGHHQEPSLGLLFLADHCATAAAWAAGRLVHPPGGLAGFPRPPWVAVSLRRPQPSPPLARRAQVCCQPAICSTWSPGPLVQSPHNSGWDLWSGGRQCWLCSTV